MKNNNILQEFEYLKRCNERNIAKILQLDAQSISIRHELEQKRRGFSLMAELAVTLSKGGDYESVFIAVSMRINAALNMQRTAILMPSEHGLFQPSILRGYSAQDEKNIAARSITVEAELLDPANPVLVNGTDSDERLASLRAALALPYLISSPIILNNEVAAILITGRTVEQPPFLTRLGQGDLETVQTVSSFLAAMLAGRHIAEAEERIKIMLDAIPVCCTFWNEACQNIDCNEAAMRMFELSSKQEYLTRFNELSPMYQPNGRLSSEMAQERINKALAEGHTKFEWMHQKLNGEPVPSEIILTRVTHGRGYIVVGYTRDLREQKPIHS
jgi:PAS domain-containing protein